jgi:hypothetical protein
MLHITQTTPANVTKALGRKAVTKFWFFDSPGEMARGARWKTKGHGEET